MKQQRRTLVAALAALAGLTALTGLVSFAPGPIELLSLLQNQDQFRRRLRGVDFFSDPRTITIKETRYAPVCTHEAIERLTSWVSSDVMTYGLRPQSVLGNLGEIYFNGLDEDLVRRVFVGNHIVVMGDSTLMRFQMHLYFVIKLMLEKDPYALSLSEKEMRPRRFESNIRPLKDSSMNVWTNMKTQVARLEDEGDTEIMFARMHQGPELQNEEFVQSIIGFRPRIVIANIGLWLFHLLNHGFDQSSVVNWIDYENYLEKVAIIAKEAGAEIVLFKTTNLVCDEKYTGDWAAGTHLYLERDNQTLEKCAFALRKEEKYAALTDEDILHYCANGHFTGRSSELLNMRLYRFVQEARERHRPLNIQIYNDQAIQSCSSTSDGRHHYPLTLARIRLLGNQLDCIFNATDAALDY